ncbi:MAG: BamA/TamA family outer membrane protein [Firmicutes bacterium]|nr:BamA/TamA family outer membrane protein [Bacillota bacterium]
MQQKIITGVMLTLCLMLGLSGIGAAEGGEADYPLAGEIVIEGCHRVDKAKVQESITHTVVGEPITEERVQSDLQAIAQTGYFYDVRASFGEGPKGLQVVFRVVENPVVTQVQIVNDVLPTEELQGYMSTRPGRVLNLEELKEDVMVLVDKAFDEYGTPVRVEDVVVNPSGEVRIIIHETRIADIMITGNNKTKDYVIRRELKVEPGDVLNMKVINQGLRRILMLGHFDEVGRDFQDTDDPDKVNLVVSVTERKTGVFTGGAGYSSNEGFIGYVEVEDQNFLGRGERVNVRWEFGKQRNNYDVGFFEPYVNENGMFMGFNLYNRLSRERRQIYKDPAGEKYENIYDQRRTGGDITLGQPLNDTTNASLRLKIENTTFDLDEEKSKAPERFEGKDGSTRSLRLQTVTNTTDHPFFPTTGMKYRLSAEMGGYLLGGDYDFMKYEADFSKYLQVGSNGQSVAFRVNTGLINGDAPLQEQFFMGGSETVRGYRYGEFIGEKALLLNGEYRFPVMKAIQGVVFVDAGNAWEREGSMSLGDLHAGYGVGVRLDTPIGVIRVDYGIGEDGGRAYFSLGQTF